MSASTDLSSGLKLTRFRLRQQSLHGLSYFFHTFFDIIVGAQSGGGVSFHLEIWQNLLYGDKTMRKRLLTLAVASFVAAQVNAGTVTSDGSDIIISTKGGLGMKTADGSKSFGLGGRIQWDYNKAEADNDPGPDEEDMGIRRARIYASGHVGNWAYKAQFNIGENGSSSGTVEDLYIRYTGFGKLANITIGKQLEPFTLEGLTSSKDISMLERSAMFEMYGGPRNTGIKLSGTGSNFTYDLGAFEDGVPCDDGGSSCEANELSLIGRVTGAIITEGSVLHGGIGYKDQSGSERSTYNLELAAVLGPFHAQAEYFDMEDDLNNEDYDGYYAQLGWIITGESRPYKNGAFRIVSPSSKAGAWELVVRHEEGDGNYSDIELGSTDGEQTAFGVNYYPNSNVRIGASYMTGEDDMTGEEGEEFRVRFQYVYK